jgi:hypothetical protein
MFERNLKRPPLARWQRLSIRRDEDFGFAQDYLIQIIAKFHGHFHRADGLHPIVRNRSCYVGEFLLQKIRGARHLNVGEMDPRSIGSLRGTKGQFHRGRLCVGSHGSRQQNKPTEENSNDHDSE